MDTNQEKITLTYQGASFKRPFIYLSIALVSLLGFIFIKFGPQAPVAGHAAGPPLAKIGLGMMVAFAFIYALMDAFFVLDFTFFQKRIECDPENLYVTWKKVETTIPFLSIDVVRPPSTFRGLNQSVRGNFWITVIEYKDADGRPKDIDLYVYPRMRGNYKLFKQWLNQKNRFVDFRG